MNNKKFKRVFLALDTNNIKFARNIVELLKNDLAGIKIGKELFSCCGPNIIKTFKKYNLPIFLDLKFHDIPTTVYKAVKVVNSLKVNYLTVHSLGGEKMIESAVKASNYTKILAVSLLSHHDQKSMKEIGIKQKIKNQIKKLIVISLKKKVSGLILSPQDLDLTRRIKKKIEIFVPGVRQEKTKKNEHKRSLDPVSAIKKGASYVIIGRPITKSKNPKKELVTINKQIEDYLLSNKI